MESISEMPFVGHGCLPCTAIILCAAGGPRGGRWVPPVADTQPQPLALPDGPYGATIEDYTQAGCLCLPAKDKVPAIKWQNLTRRLPPDPKWDGYNIAMKTGSLSGVTVVDIDSTEPEIWLAMAERFGNPAIITSTPRGGRP